MKALVTIPPYAPYLQKLAEHPMVEGFRLNTVSPVKEPLDELLKRLVKVAGDKPIWLDLKTRQIRVKRGVFYDAPEKPIVLEIGGKRIVLDPSKPKNYGNLVTPPWAIIEIDHEIDLDTTVPVKCYMNDGLDTAYIARVDGNRLIMLDGPQKVVGGGESINVRHPSLKIKGFLTDLDKEYIAAGKRNGINKVMLSYVEEESDILDTISINKDAEIIAKIESEKGLAFIDAVYPRLKNTRLMAARGDLYVEVKRPHNMLKATRKIIEADSEAIAASRLFTSLRNSYHPSCQDISDVGFLMEIGYRHFMIGDDICYNEDSIMSALNILDAIQMNYVPRKKYSSPAKIMTAGNSQ